MIAFLVRNVAWFVRRLRLPALLIIVGVGAGESMQRRCEAAGEGATAPRPNIVVILADDK